MRAFSPPCLSRGGSRLGERLEDALAHAGPAAAAAAGAFRGGGAALVAAGVEHRQQALRVRVRACVRARV